MAHQRAFTAAANKKALLCHKAQSPLILIEWCGLMQLSSSV
jgi:hypothetical protein